MSLLGIRECDGVRSVQITPAEHLGAWACDGVTDARLHRRECDGVFEGLKHRCNSLTVCVFPNVCYPFLWNKSLLEEEAL